MKKILYIATIGFTLLTSSCNDFLDRQVPQGIVTGDQIASPEYVDNLVISAYAIWATGDDINSSFSLWNYDVRSDDCYKGGSGTEDGGVFNALEISKGINTTDWNINDIWKRPVSYTHLDVYKRQSLSKVCVSSGNNPSVNSKENSVEGSAHPFSEMRIYFKPFSLSNLKNPLSELLASNSGQ